MRCDFCFRHCDISEGGWGWCNARTVRNGRLEDRAYGHLSSVAVDPVEKKPLYLFLPGTKTLSVAMEGCCLDCAFCQNHDISRSHHDFLPFISPHDTVDYAVENDIPSISFTYSEPLVWQDYAAETATLAKESGLRTIMVTNGEFSKEALTRLLPLIDAYNIDVKGDEGFYRDICRGRLSPVLDGIERIIAYGSHVEVTTLLIEGIHTEAMIGMLGRTLKDRGVEAWHLTRFFPAFRMIDRRATSERFLSMMLESADRSGIRYIFPGNSRQRRPLLCPICQKETSPVNGRCSECGSLIEGLSHPGTLS